MCPRVSIIIPTLNEAAVVESLLGRLGHDEVELIVVDGGSCDGTGERALPLADQVLRHSAGRAIQMNAGAAVARGEWLWFLHADSVLLAPGGAYLEAITAAEDWGFFGLVLSGERRVFRLIERLIVCRSRITAVATGDQGIFVRRGLFQTLGGFVDQPLMEDVELSKRLRAVAPPGFVALPLQTSSRRWESGGVLRTVLLMWRLRLLYFLGASPRWLARQYR